MSTPIAPESPYNTGGPPYPDHPTDEGGYGLSILDWFAAHVMTGLAARSDLTGRRSQKYRRAGRLLDCGEDGALSPQHGHRSETCSGFSSRGAAPRPGHAAGFPAGDGGKARLKRHAPMRRVSRRRKQEGEAYSILRKAFLEARPFCEAKVGNLYAPCLRRTPQKW